MKSILTITDLALDKELGRHDLAAVRGGNGNQANATQQSNAAGMIAPVLVGNGSKIEGGGMVLRLFRFGHRWSSPKPSGIMMEDSKRESAHGRIPWQTRRTGSTARRR